MRLFKIILFTILINIPLFKSAEIIEEKINDDIYASKSFSESEAIDILQKLNENIDTFNYIAPDNNKYDPRNCTLVVIMDNESVLKTFCASLTETTKITVKDIETSENEIFEFILLKTAFVMNEYKNKLIKVLKSLFKDKLSLIINTNENNPSITILCKSPKKIRIKNDLIKAYTNFINTELKSERYNEVSAMCNDKFICDNVINIMITQFISNLICSSLVLFPTLDSDNQDINTIIYTRTPLTKHSEKIEDKKAIESIKELME